VTSPEDYSFSLTADQPMIAGHFRSKSNCASEHHTFARCGHLHALAPGGSLQAIPDPADRSLNFSHMYGMIRRRATSTQSVSATIRFRAGTQIR
jgi:hypothetical protein